MRGTLTKLLSLALISGFSYPAQAQVTSPEGRSEGQQLSSYDRSTSFQVSARVPLVALQQDQLPEVNLTPETAAQTAYSSIKNGQGVSLSFPVGRLTLSLPVDANNGEITTTATYSLLDSPHSQSQSSSLEVSQPAGSTAQNVQEGSVKSQVIISLKGNGELVANTAAFLATAMGNKASAAQAEAGASITMAGTDYRLTHRLIESIAGIFITDGNKPQSENVEVNLKRFKDAIETYNQVINDSSDQTIFALAENQYFLEIGSILRNVRSSIYH